MSKGRRSTMHYVIGDIHNEAKKFRRILEKISLGPSDEVILLGDLFDRGVDPDPVEVYFTVLGLGKRCTWIRGNHDQWLSRYIKSWLALSKKQRRRMQPYPYDTFEMLLARMTEVDLLRLADHVRDLPLQKALSIDGKQYVFAHAQTSDPSRFLRKFDFHMDSGWDYQFFLKDGIEGYISMCGHMVNCNVGGFAAGRYLEPAAPSLWVNARENVYLLDCGCGFGDGSLGAYCLETGERYYV